MILDFIGVLNLFSLHMHFENLQQENNGHSPCHLEYALVAASHGYILVAHMNECTLLNNAMQRSYKWDEFYKLITYQGPKFYRS